MEIGNRFWALVWACLQSDVPRKMRKIEEERRRETGTDKFDPSFGGIRTYRQDGQICLQHIVPLNTIRHRLENGRVERWKRLIRQIWLAGEDEVQPRASSPSR